MTKRSSKTNTKSQSGKPGTKPEAAVQGAPLAGNPQDGWLSEAQVGADGALEQYRSVGTLHRPDDAGQAPAATPDGSGTATPDPLADSDADHRRHKYQSGKQTHR